MEKVTPIILGILAIIIAFLSFCWVPSIAAWYDKILDFIAKIKPFNAKRKYKNDLRLIRNERNQIKEEINNSIGYCYIRIIYKENIDWLKRKAFKLQKTNDKAEYKISWRIQNDSQS